MKIYVTILPNKIQVHENKNLIEIIIFLTFHIIIIIYQIFNLKIFKIFWEKFSIQNILFFHFFI